MMAPTQRRKSTPSMGSVGTMVRTTCPRNPSARSMCSSAAVVIVPMICREVQSPCISFMLPLALLRGFKVSFPSLTGQGGVYLEGTFELTILEATGGYQPFTGGHNHMVDRLHKLASAQLDGFCFCNISTYQFP